MIYALDSNIISYVLKNDEEVINRYRQEAIGGNEYAMPIIVYYEVKRWLLERGAKNKQAMFDEMCQTIPLGEFDKRVWDKTADLYVHSRKIGKPTGDSDLLIASYCLVNGYTLVTNNTKHFEHIDGLNLVNWKN
jgi:predicted nucleic acid-binding protein